MKTLDQLKRNLAKNCFEINADSPALFYINGNRPINVAHSTNIYKAMLNKEDIPPILVDSKTLAIIDGQHRYAAARRIWADGNKEYVLNTVIMDFVDPFEAAIKYNSSSKNWTTDNFVSGYVAINNINYIRLADFCNDNKEMINSQGRVLYASALNLLRNISTSVISSGKLIITEDHIETANVLLKELRIIRTALEYRYSEKDVNKLFAAHNIKAYIDARKIVLGDGQISFSEYVANIKERFIIPTTNGTVWKNEYLRVK